MEKKVTFDYSKAAKFISADEVTSMERIVEQSKEVLVSRNGAGNDFLGWIDLPVDYDKEEFSGSSKEDLFRQRSAGSNRNRRILSGSKSCNRIPSSQFL